MPVFSKQLKSTSSAVRMSITQSLKCISYHEGFNNGIRYSTMQPQAQRNSRVHVQAAAAFACNYMHKRVHSVQCNARDCS